jgi:hypothetical protein
MKNTKPPIRATSLIAILGCIPILYFNNNGMEVAAIIVFVIQVICLILCVFDIL